MTIDEISKIRHRFLQTEPSLNIKIKFCMSYENAIRFATVFPASHCGSDDGGSFRNGLRRIINDLELRKANYWSMGLTEQFLCELAGMEVYVQVPMSVRDVVHAPYYITEQRG